MSISLVDIPQSGGFDAEIHGRSVSVSEVSYSTKNILAGSIFCCVRGSKFDGHDLAAEALQSGAVALMVDHVLPIDAPQLVVSDVRKCMALTSAVINNHPSNALTVVGVTGTDGKTTTAHMIGAILSASGLKTAVHGTLTSDRTTPEAPDLQRMMGQWLADGGQAFVMEVSSHGLDQHRVDGTIFAVSVFTNLSRDHLDYHKTEEAYFRAKARLFEPELSMCGVVNRDDVHGRLIMEVASIPVIEFGIEDVSALKVTPSTISYQFESMSVSLPMGGSFNVLNSLAAIKTARHLGIADDVIVRGLASMQTVPGRLEPVSNDRGFTVLVDYAHTPEALEKVLTTIRDSINPGGRLLLVFGCGGDRDHGKRAHMGAVAARLSDITVITADNSRSERTEDIIEEIEAGYLEVNGSGTLFMEVDRRLAIEAAIGLATTDDVVVIAGKGHESIQEIGGVISRFSDVEVAAQVLRGEE